MIHYPKTAQNNYLIETNKKGWRSVSNLSYFSQIPPISIFRSC